jgi:hypothetical protein
MYTLVGISTYPINFLYLIGPWNFWALNQFISFCLPSVALRKVNCLKVSALWSFDVKDTAHGPPSDWWGTLLLLCPPSYWNLKRMRLNLLFACYFGCDFIILSSVRSWFLCSSYKYLNEGGSNSCISQCCLFHRWLITHSNFKI